MTQRRVRVILSAEDAEGVRTLDVYVDGYLAKGRSAKLWRGDSCEVTDLVTVDPSIGYTSNTEPDLTRPEPPERFDPRGYPVTRKAGETT